jgi:hypothetical protein
MTVTALLSVLFQPSPLPARSVFIPTSDVVDIARSIARDEGFAVQDRKLFFVDTLDSGRRRLDGFVSVAVYQNGHIVLEISINEKTGQVVDSTRCLLFEFPDAAAFSASIQTASGVRPLTQAALEKICGCVLKVQRVPHPPTR